MQAAYAKSTAQDNQERAARQQFDQMLAFVGSEEALAMPHDEMEEWLGWEGRELQRRLLQQHCDLRAASEVRLFSVQGADGVERGVARQRPRVLGSMFGSVTVWRLAYQAESSASLHPLDAGLNLPPGQYSYGVRRLVAEYAARSSFDEVVVEIERWTGATVHKRQVEELARTAAQDFDAFYAQRRLDTARVGRDNVVVITSDAKGIVVRPEDLREATRRAAAQEQHKLSKRLTRGEKRNRKRMAQVAVVYAVEPFVRDAEDVLREFRPVREVTQRRPRPTHKRAWASVAQNPTDRKSG